jgi:hypothetical protein
MTIKKNFHLLTVLVLFVVLISTVSSCRKEGLYTGNDAILSFSADTLMFDTVFTTVGTVTRNFRIENTSNKTLVLDINLQNLDGLGTFRINIDGTSGTAFKNIEIPANDYIYAFAEATIDYGNTNNPFIIADAIEYKYNNTIQNSYLQAWGQDAYFHSGVIYSQDVVWINDKPHVIVRDTFFGGFGVDTFSSLTIEPGCQIYTTFGAGLYVEGELNIGLAGNQEQVTFQSDRIETLQNGVGFDDKAGLWTGIVLFSGSKAEIYNTSINQATVGIQGRLHTSINVLIDNTSRPEILLDKVEIKNSSQNAFIAINCKSSVTNSLFYASGSQTVAIALGGEATFDNCTIYNNGTSGSDASEAIILSNFAQTSIGEGGLNHLDKADFTNTIIHGSAEEKLAFSTDDQVDFNYSFTNCLIKSQLESEGGFTDCLFNQDPNFEDTAEDNFHLKDTSPCINAGIDNGILVDIYFTPRGNFDIGAVAY